MPRPTGVPPSVRTRHSVTGSYRRSRRYVETAPQSRRREAFGMHKVQRTRNAFRTTGAALVYPIVLSAADCSPRSSTA